jgi:methylmalonyl-CoA mutase
MTAAPPPPPEHLSLAALFPEADRAQWQQLVATALRKSGRIDQDAPADSVEAVLTSLTYDGIGVLPLYTAEDAPAVDAGLPGSSPFIRGSQPRSSDDSAPIGWDVRQRHNDPDPDVTREAIMTDLENGVTSLWLTIGRGGLPLGSLEHVLRDVFLDLAPIVLDAGADTEAAAAEFLGVIAGRGVLPESVRGNLGADPIGLRARTGGTTPDLASAVRLAHRCLAEAPGVRAITVDATVHHDAGGSDAEELGASLATGLAYLRALTGAGLSLEQAFDQLDFRYAASADQFLTIAKFRAARRLWGRVAQVCGPTDGRVAGQRQHAVTSSAMMTRRDPWVNMLRTTLACFGAGVGGADAVTVQPFDAAIGLPDGFARRIARNTSSLLVMESHVARVVDPAGGSWYVERLTDDLAGSAWNWFTEIEQHGGIVAALETGLIGRRLADTWARRADNLAHRRDALTGVSEFPNLTEESVDRRPYPSDESAPTAPGGLPQRRYAQDYEAFRDAADAHTLSTGERPAVFLATLGPAAVHTARASFAANLFQAGGLATPTSGSVTDPAEVVAAFRASGARAACLATSDRLYTEHAVPVAMALTAAGAGPIWLAGSPGDRAAEYSAAGIDHFIFTGVNALGVLRDVHHQVGIAEGTVGA